MKYICFFILSVIMSSCVLSTWDTRLVLANNTSKKIRYLEQIKDSADFTFDTVNCNTGELYWVASNSEEIIQRQDKWEFSLKKANKTLRIYIVNEDSLSKYGTCKVFKSKMFMKRYDLTYDDLEKLNWKVVYDEK